MKPRSMSSPTPHPLHAKQIHFVNHHQKCSPPTPPTPTTSPQQNHHQKMLASPPQLIASSPQMPPSPPLPILPQQQNCVDHSQQTHSQHPPKIVHTTPIAAASINASHTHTSERGRVSANCETE
ncbi:hypothetical protein KC19_6G126400 [Ceratodon purpureus]|uniref:Uncharacterized protein n=1 Tax=Ceratodon purpureus TaxID=3225 RepID=A0A8T0HHM5_CERPU|nr:hypothetical protein KC19_6G126400 [Ceratodon purpureus]